MSGLRHRGSGIWENLALTPGPRDTCLPAQMPPRACGASRTIRGPAVTHSWLGLRQRGLSGKATFEQRPEVRGEAVWISRQRRQVQMSWGGRVPDTLEKQQGRQGAGAGLATGWDEGDKEGRGWGLRAEPQGDRHRAPLAAVVLMDGGQPGARLGKLEQEPRWGRGCVDAGLWSDLGKTHCRRVWEGEGGAGDPVFCGLLAGSLLPHLTPPVSPAHQVAECFPKCKANPSYTVIPDLFFHLFFKMVF